MLQSELAGAMKIARPTATRALDGLAIKGLVERRATKRDGRECEIYPTAEAVKLKDGLNAASGYVTSQLRSALGASIFSGFVEQAKVIANNGQMSFDAYSCIANQWRNRMPILNVKISAKRSDEMTKAIGALLIELTSRILGKDPKVTAIAIDYVDPRDWIAGGKTLAEQGKSSVYFDVKVTDETNTKDEKARYILEAFRRICRRSSAICTKRATSTSRTYAAPLTAMVARHRNIVFNTRRPELRRRRTGDPAGRIRMLNEQPPP